MPKPPLPALRTLAPDIGAHRQFIGKCVVCRHVVRRILRTARLLFPCSPAGVLRRCQPCEMSLIVLMNSILSSSETNVFVERF